MHERKINERMNAHTNKKMKEKQNKKKRKDQRRTAASPHIMQQVASID
jgi:hypothetical protein